MKEKGYLELDWVDFAKKYNKELNLLLKTEREQTVKQIIDLLLENGQIRAVSIINKKHRWYKE